MPSDEHNAEASLARGIKAYSKQHFAEAAVQFEKAVAISPGCVEAHLALGAARLTLYKRRPSPRSPDYLRAKRDVSEAELKAYREREQAILAEQNLTNWPLAEESLKRANRLAPQNKLVMEYLCALYFAWKYPLDPENNRLEEEKEWLERLAEVYPEHPYANYYCGSIAVAQARRLLPDWRRRPLRDHERFPGAPEAEEDRRSLRTKIGPLLEQATRHLSRALTLDSTSVGGCVSWAM